MQSLYPRQALVAASLLVGLRTGATPAMPDGVVLLSAGDPEYTALAVPRSYKTAPDAPNHLLVFRGGLCIRDLGLEDDQTNGEHAAPGQAVVEQAGIKERAFVAPDGRAAVVSRTRYVS